MSRRLVSETYANRFCCVFCWNGFVLSQCVCFFQKAGSFPDESVNDMKSEPSTSSPPRLPSPKVTPLRLSLNRARESSHSEKADICSLETPTDTADSNVNDTVTSGEIDFSTFYHLYRLTKRRFWLKKSYSKTGAVCHALRIKKRNECNNEKQ